LGIYSFATFVIVAFTNAVNITDGLDVCFGLQMIGFVWFVDLSSSNWMFHCRFYCLWLGSLISLLYFNIYPARLIWGFWYLAFGATLAIMLAVR
jgi:UDP-N-acetylmuramyl pentapeptide phosphotransferase/UDP-N-acetylglucosamine-1-phosphate transferase